MSDERDQPGATGDGDTRGDSGGHSHTTLATRPAMRPQRPTGKRSRQRGPVAGDNGGGVDVVSEATELTGDGLDAPTEKIKKAEKHAKAKKGGPTTATAGQASRNVFAPLASVASVIGYVYNYLKQVTAELRKVIWPNRKQMITYTSVVLAFLVFMVALVAGSDYGFAKLVLLVFGE